jgi:DNA-nicking Smr family endonuclease
MTSDSDIWNKIKKEFKQLKNKNTQYSFDNHKIEELAAKIKEKNKNDLKIKPSQKSKIQISFPDFKLEKGISLGLDKNTDKKLKAGEYPIDLKLDLHGLNLEDAYFKLKDTINYAFEKGYRLILVITGKGLHSEENKITIKHSMKNWLSHSEFSSKIIKYVDANKKHGGKGAIYILLRRKREV